MSNFIAILVLFCELKLQSSFRTVSEQCPMNVQPQTVTFQSNIKSCLKQVQDHFRVISHRYSNDFRAISVQLNPRSFRAISKLLLRNYRAFFDKGFNTQLNNRDSNSKSSLVQFQSRFRAVLLWVQSSSGQVPQQLPMNASVFTSAISIQIKNFLQSRSRQFQSNFRTISVPFQSNLRAVIEKYCSPKWTHFKSHSKSYSVQHESSARATPERSAVTHKFVNLTNSSSNSKNTSSVRTLHQSINFNIHQVIT